MAHGIDCVGGRWGVGCSVRLHIGRVYGKRVASFDARAVENHDRFRRRRFDEDSVQPFAWLGSAATYLPTAWSTEAGLCYRGDCCSQQLCCMCRCHPMASVLAQVIESNRLCQTLSAPNLSVNPTAQKLRSWVLSVLRTPAAGYFQRSASYQRAEAHRLTSIITVATVMHAGRVRSGQRFRESKETWRFIGLGRRTRLGCRAGLD